MEKIIKPFVGLILIGWLLYIGVGILFNTSNSVIHRMNDRAEESRREAKIKDCERAKLNYKSYPSEKTKSDIFKSCKDSSL